MAFTLSKAAGARVPDEIFIDVAYALVDIGQAVELDGTVAVAGSPVAGVVTSQYDSTGGLSSATFSPTFPKGPDGDGNVEALVLPVTGTLLFEADVPVPSATIVVGYEAGLTTAGTGIEVDATNNDFRVLKVLATTDAGLATKVQGVFLSPGYFAS